MQKQNNLRPYTNLYSDVYSNFLLKIDKENENNKKINHKNEENKSFFINNIKYKFNELLLDKNSDEKNYLKCINEIFEFIKRYYKDIELNNIQEPLIESLTLEKIILYNLIKNQFIYNQEILNLLLLIFSCILFIYNKLQNAQILKYIFISNKKYINLYLSLFNIEDDETIYNSYKFIGLLSQDSIEITEKLNNGNFLH